MARKEAEKISIITPSDTTTEKKIISDPGKQAEDAVVNRTGDYAEEDTENPAFNSQFLASASTSPFQQQDYTNVGATTGGTSTNSSSNDTSDNGTKLAQPATGLPPMYNAPFLNHRIDQPQHPTQALLALQQQQQQQQQNFQQYGTSALYPPEGIFGTNNSTALPISTMSHHQMQNMYATNSNQMHNPAGVSVGALPGQFSRMMAVPNPQNDATMQQQEQLSALAMARNQGLAMSQLLMQNPGLMLGGWNGMDSGRMQLTQQGAAPSGGGSTSQPNQGFTWPNLSSHNHQQL